jgi:hypothetical protein
MNKKTPTKKLNILFIYFIVSGILLVATGAVIKLGGHGSGTWPLISGTVMSVVSTLAWVFKK